MLVFAGASRVYRRLRPAAEPEHDHDDGSAVHVHTGRGSLAVAEDLPVSQWHHGHHGRPGHHHHRHPEADEPFTNYGRRYRLRRGHDPRRSARRLPRSS